MSFGSDADFFSDIFKVVLIGDANVGKSALVYRYVHNQKAQHLASTVGVEFTKRIIIEPGSQRKVQLHIWDTAGQERFKSVTTHHYRGADAALLVYDVMNERSFREIPKWLEEVRDNVEPDTVVCLVANKADLIEDSPDLRKVSAQDGKDFAEKHGLLYCETSGFWDREHVGTLDLCPAGIEKCMEKIVGAVVTRNIQRDLASASRSQSMSKDGFDDDRKTIRVEGMKLDTQQLFDYHTSSNSKCAC